jgi:cyclic pyranopterin phosphate synthase
MRLFAFDDIGPELDLVPLAARRALDLAGVKLSLAAFRSLSLELRRELASLGSVAEVDTARVHEIAALAEPPPAALPVAPDPSPVTVPPELVAALGLERPLDAGVWSALEPLERYALAKLARGSRAERLGGAYSEIVGKSALSTHLAADGQARMVGISRKVPSERRAVAESRIAMNAATFERLVSADAPKGDVLGTARLAGIMAAKRTSELIPLCHPVKITRVDVSLAADAASRSVLVRVTVEAFDRTGVEMEALTAASTAALTVYDMLKAFDRGMEIGPTRLLEKSGGVRGDFRR